jgi:hypothetical protein
MQVVQLLTIPVAQAVWGKEVLAAALQVVVVITAAAALMLAAAAAEAAMLLQQELRMLAIIQVCKQATGRLLLLGSLLIDYSLNKYFPHFFRPHASMFKQRINLLF